jgi:hypothetical protein
MCGRHLRAQIPSFLDQSFRFGPHSGKSVGPPGRATPRIGMVDMKDCRAAAPPLMDAKRGTSCGKAWHAPIVLLNQRRAVLFRRTLPVSAPIRTRPRDSLGWPPFRLQNSRCTLPVVTREHWRTGVKIFLGLPVLFYLLLSVLESQKTIWRKPTKKVLIAFIIAWSAVFCLIVLIFAWNALR